MLTKQHRSLTLNRQTVNSSLGIRHHKWLNRTEQWQLSVKQLVGVPGVFKPMSLPAVSINTNASCPGIKMFVASGRWTEPITCGERCTCCRYGRPLVALRVAGSSAPVLDGAAVFGWRTAARVIGVQHRQLLTGDTDQPWPHQRVPTAQQTVTAANAKANANAKLS